MLLHAQAGTDVAQDRHGEHRAMLFIGGDAGLHLEFTAVAASALREVVVRDRFPQRTATDAVEHHRTFNGSDEIEDRGPQQLLGGGEAE